MSEHSALIKLVHERDTKRKSVYSETSPGGILDSLYINTVSLRTIFGGRLPETLEIRIEEGKDNG